MYNLEISKASSTFDENFIILSVVPQVKSKGTINEGISMNYLNGLIAISGTTNKNICN